MKDADLILAALDQLHEARLVTGGTHVHMNDASAATCLAMVGSLIGTAIRDLERVSRSDGPRIRQIGETP